MWSAKQNISQAGKGVFPRFLVMSLRKILETFIGFFSPSFKRKYVHTFVHTAACTVVFVGPAGFVFNATCPLSFQLFQQKRWSRGRLNCISMLACKGPVCVAVLTNFYGRFFVEVGQFINSKSFHLGRHFCHLLTPPRFGEFNPESESSGSQQVYRKLFPRGPHSSKNNFFEIKISRPTPLDSLSVLFWLLTMVENFTSSSYSPTWKHVISRLDFIAAEQKRILAHN